MHVLPQQKGSLARVLSSVCFMVFPGALNIPVQKKKNEKIKKFFHFTFYGTLFLLKVYPNMQC